MTPPPIKDMERLWLTTAVAYEVFDVGLMPDHDWDLMAKALNDRRPEWSPYFRKVIERAEDLGGYPRGTFNVGTTASGIDWDGPLAVLYRDSARLKYGDVAV